MARAFGKVILLGEHGVVYSTPAIAAGIQLGATAQAELVNEPSSLELSGARVSTSHQGELAEAFKRLLRALGAPPQLQVKLALDLPSGVGLGASAAMAVAVCRACLEALGRAQDEDLIFHAANQWESVFHGNPSGVDVAAALSTSPIWYERQKRPTRIRCAAQLLLAIGLAGPPASTKEMVGLVKTHGENNPEAFATQLRTLTELAHEARRSIEAHTPEALGALLNQAHQVLTEFGVSTEGIERAREIAKRKGALGSKLTGAGGGGAVIALMGSASEAASQISTSELLASWAQAGIQGFSTVLGEASVEAP